MTRVALAHIQLKNEMELIMFTCSIVELENIPETAGALIIVIGLNSEFSDAVPTIEADKFEFYKFRTVDIGFKN